LTMTSSQITVFTGRFGSGKTEIAVNYALDLARQGQSPLLIDLDIVTPYFRTRDRAEDLASLGVEVVAPYPAGQHIHIPAINPQIRGAIEQRERPVVIDLGGDPQGSRALAQFAELMPRRSLAVCFVVNPYRPFMDSVPGIRDAIHEIEASAKVAVSHLISNPNLMSESTLELFHQGHTLVQEASQALDLPIAFAVAGAQLAEQLKREANGIPLLTIDRFFLMLDTSG